MKFHRLLEIGFQRKMFAVKNAAGPVRGSFILTMFAFTMLARFLLHLHFRTSIACYRNADSGKNKCN